MWQLRMMTRDVDGVLRALKATEPTKAACRARIRDEVEQRKNLGYLASRLRGVKSVLVPHGEDWISPDDTFLRAAEVWLLVRVGKRNRVNATSKQKYAEYVDLTIRNRGDIAGVRVRDLTTPRLNRHAFQMADGQLPLRSVDRDGNPVLKSVGREIPTTAGKFRDIAGLILDLAVSHGALTVNPARGMDVVDENVTLAEINVPELDLLDKMRDALELWWLRGQPEPGKSGRPRDPQRSVIAFWEILCASGMRPGEVLALRPQDCIPYEPGVTVPLAADIPPMPKLVLRVRGTVVTVAGVGTYRQAHPKTDASNRDLVIGEPFIPEVVRMLVANWETGLLFPNSRGKPMQLQNMARRMRQAIAESDMDPITARGVRKVIATYLADTESAREQLGHADRRTTEGHYRKRRVPLVDHSEEIAIFSARGADEPDVALGAPPAEHWWTRSAAEALATE
jgi:integrase